MQTATTSAAPTATGKKVTRIGRLSFADIYKARGGNLKRDDGSDQEPKFGAHIIFAADSDAAKAMRQACLDVAQQKWGVNHMNVLTAMEASKKCLRQGNSQLDKAGAIREGYGGNMYVVARSKKAPLVLADKFHNGAPVEVREDGSTWQNGQRVPVEWKVTPPYGGCWARVQVEVYAYEGTGDKAKHGKSINATLLAVQFFKDDKAFSGTQADLSDFSEVGGPGVTSQAGGADPFSSDPFAQPSGQVAAPAPQADPFAG